jgi:hypothetical protein
MKGRKLLLMLAVITALVIAFSGCDMDADKATINIINSTTKNIRFYLGEYVDFDDHTPCTSTGTISAGTTLSAVNFPGDTDLDIWYVFELPGEIHYVILSPSAGSTFNFPIGSTQTIELFDDFSYALE